MKRNTSTNRTSHCVAWLYGLAALSTVMQGYTLQAQTWETVVDYQFVSGVDSSGVCLAADASGSVFIGGIGYDTASYSTRTSCGLALQTDSTEASWLLSDDTNPDPNQYNSLVWSLGFGGNGDAYSVGQITPKCSAKSCPGSSWYVRKTSDFGESWAVTDQFQYAAGNNARANGFAADPGNLYVAGFGYDKTGARHWIVRKSADNGQTWVFADDVKGGPSPNAVHLASDTGALFVAGGEPWIVRSSVDAGVTWSTVDTFQPSASTGSTVSSAAAQGVSSDKQGNLYAVGNAVYNVKTGKSYTQSFHGIVRESSNGGNSWATVDELAGPVGTAAGAWGVGRDAAGSAVVVGGVPDTQGTSHWVVRSNSSGAWQTVDDFQLAPGRGALARGVVTDAAGSLLVTGSAIDAMGATHWVVRRLAPAP